ncbi:ATP-dependent helicase hrpA [Klebsiella michiganensis]|uniref:ATP-dependent helicase hrpA n=1 Tax=Klebsiella michiganensis TaxID=1134687 RepID=A0A7H4LTL8_9ENTR|nr:ATP-dependent helicase hrpA [Klebsiella michiganensis]
MTALGLGDIAAFPFVEAPDKRNIQDGVRLLEELGAITTDEQQTAYKLTPMGRQLSQLPVDPRLARMVLEAQKHGCVREAMIITSALSIQDPRERPMDKQQASDEKHRASTTKSPTSWRSSTCGTTWASSKKRSPRTSSAASAGSIFSTTCACAEWQDIYTQLRQVVKELGLPVNSEPAEYREIHTALLTGLLSHIGMKDADKQEFTGARNARFSIFPGSGLFKKPPKWTMVAELVETSRLWGRIAARIEPEWVEPVAQHLIKRSYSEPHWERGQGAVMATEEGDRLRPADCRCPQGQLQPD